MGCGITFKRKNYLQKFAFCALLNLRKWYIPFLKKWQNVPWMRHRYQQSTVTWCLDRPLTEEWLLGQWRFSPQRAKKVVSDSPGHVDFAIGLVNSVINLPNGQVKFFEEFKVQKNCEINLLIKMSLGLVEVMFELVNVSFSLPEWQAVKMTFFAPWPTSYSWLRLQTGIIFALEQVRMQES